MTRIYFTYRFRFNPNDNNCKYTPSSQFYLVYPELNGTVKMEDTFISDTRIKEFAPGLSTGKRLGYIEADASVLLQFGYTIEQSIAEFQGTFRDFCIQQISNTEASDFIRNNTDYIEVSDNVFELARSYTTPE